MEAMSIRVTLDTTRDTVDTETDKYISRLSRYNKSDALTVPDRDIIVIE